MIFEKMKLSGRICMDPRHMIIGTEHNKIAGASADGHPWFAILIQVFSCDCSAWLSSIVRSIQRGLLMRVIVL